MTTFEFIVPLIALALGGVAVLYVRWLDRRFDREDPRHPAE